MSLSVQIMRLLNKEESFFWFLPFLKRFELHCHERWVSVSSRLAISNKLTQKCNFTRTQSRFSSRLEIFVKHRSLYNKTMQQIFTSVKCNGRSFFSLHLVCTTVAPWTFRWCNKTVNVIRPTVDHGDVQYESATAIGQLGKADPSGNFTVFHWRMVVIQPAWKNCITSMPTNAFVWHSCSCCSHETIPSPESTVTWHFIEDCDVRALSVGITQDFVINTWVDCTVSGSISSG